MIPTRWIAEVKGLNGFVAALAAFFLILGAAFAVAAVGILISRLQAQGEYYGGGLLAIPAVVLLVSVPFLHYGIWLLARARGRRLPGGGWSFAIMGLALLAAGLVFGSAADVWQARRSAYWRPSDGHVVESRVVTKDRGERLRKRWGPRFVDELELKVAFKANGQQYVGEVSGEIPGKPSHREAIERYPIGKVVHFFYDAEHPQSMHWSMPAPLAPKLALHGLLVVSCLGAIYTVYRSKIAAPREKSSSGRSA